jgi:hypothetical protein
MVLRILIGLLLTLFTTKLFAFDEANFAESLGLELVTGGHPYNFLGVNRMYANDSLSRQLLVMTEVPAELKEKRILHAKGYLILEIPLSEKTYISMALVGIDEDEIKRKIVTTSLWQKFWPQLNPLPMAYGNDDCVVSGTPETPGIEQLSQYYGKSYLKGALSCIGNALSGVVGSTYGRFKDTVEGIQHLITDPIGFWDKKVQGLNNIVEFIKNFDSRIKSLAASISQLPAETKVQMICSFVGNLGGDAILAMLAGGAGLGSVLFRMEAYVMKLVKLENVFSFLNHDGKLRFVPMQFFERLMTSKIPPSMLESMNLFANRRLTEVLQGAMSCGL